MDTPPNDVKPVAPEEGAKRENTERRRINLGMLGKLCVVTAMMFGFGYGMVPLYKALCEVTGLNVLTPIDQDAAKIATNSQVDTSRWVTVEFDANSHGPWGFKPKTASLRIHPGELTSITYVVKNNENRTMQAQAIPSYAPMQATTHFHKLECFCFKQQTLEAKEQKEYPVVFVVDNKLPKDVQTITLSYTFFEVGQGGAATEPGTQPAATVTNGG